MFSALPHRIVTERLIVRRYDAADAPALREGILSSLDRLRPFMEWARDEPRPLADHAATIAWFNEEFDAGRDFSYGMFDRATGDFLGSTGYHVRGDALEIGYWVTTAAEGLGYASEASAALAHVALHFRGDSRVELANDPANARSRRVAAAARLRRYGTRHRPVRPGRPRPDARRGLGAHAQGVRELPGRRVPAPGPVRRLGCGPRLARLTRDKPDIHTTPDGRRLGAMSGPIADVSVRPAIPGDESIIADVQLSAWRKALGPDIAGVIPREPIEASWRASIASPPTREHRVFTATDGPNIVGFAAIAPGGELVALEVAPEHRRKGHGARLLAACVDSMRIAGAPHMRAWALASDRPRQAFFESAGLAPGGVERVLEGPEGGIPESLWRAEI